MPVIYTEAVWRSLYRVVPPNHKGVAATPEPITYSRLWEFGLTGYAGGSWQSRSESPRLAQRRDALTGYGLDNNARVGVFGAGFGYLQEHLIDAGITECWGVEPSPYIWANTSEMRPDVLAKTINATIGVDTKATIQGLLAAAGYGNPRTFDWIVDEDAISSQTDDAGIAAFITGCEDLLQGNARSRIVHLVTPLPPDGPGDSAILWKSMATWKAYAPTHTWVDTVTGAVA